jgi:hypothetical protein
MSLELKKAIAGLEEETNRKMLSLRRAHNGILKGGNAHEYGFQAFYICEKKYKLLEQKHDTLKKQYATLEREKNALKTKYHAECKIQCKQACDAKIETVKTLLKQEYDALCDRKIETMEQEKEAKVQAMKDIYLNLIKEMGRIESV